MNAKDKAKELISKFWIFADNSDTFGQHIIIKNFNAKQCALICVDEILNELTELHHKTPLLFWKEVKQEIEKL